MWDFKLFVLKDEEENFVYEVSVIYDEFGYCCLWEILFCFYDIGVFELNI